MSILMASDYVFFDFVSILHDVVGLLLVFLVISLLFQWSILMKNIWSTLVLFDDSFFLVFFLFLPFFHHFLPAVFVFTFKVVVAPFFCVFF